MFYLIQLGGYMNHLDNIILDFGVSDKSIQDLVSRLEQKNQNYKIVKVDKESIANNPTLLEKQIFSQVDINTRVYIYAHGGLSRPDKIIGFEHPNQANHGKQIEFKFDEVSDYLTSRLNVNKLKEESTNLKISVIACHQGLRTGDKEYFASQLHRDLGKRKELKTDIVARRGITGVVAQGAYRGQKMVRKFEERQIDDYTGKNITDLSIEKTNQMLAEQIKKPGSKSKFIWNDQGQQVMVDAYLNKYAKLTKSICNEMLLNRRENVISQEEVSRLNEIIKLCSKEELLNVVDVENIQKSIVSIASKLNYKSNKLTKTKNIFSKSIRAKKDDKLILNNYLNGYFDKLLKESELKTELNLLKDNYLLYQTRAETEKSLDPNFALFELVKDMYALLKKKNLLEKYEENFFKLVDLAKQVIADWNTLEPQIIGVDNSDKSSHQETQQTQNIPQESPSNEGVRNDFDNFKDELMNFYDVFPAKMDNLSSLARDKISEEFKKIKGQYRSQQHADPAAAVGKLVKDLNSLLKGEHFDPETRKECLRLKGFAKTEFSRLKKSAKKALAI